MRDIFRIKPEADRGEYRQAADARAVKREAEEDWGPLIVEVQ
jgi:hypothetical protein